MRKKPRCLKTNKKVQEVRKTGKPKAPYIPEEDRQKMTTLFRGGKTKEIKSSIPLRLNTPSLYYHCNYLKTADYFNMEF